MRTLWVTVVKQSICINYMCVSAAFPNCVFMQPRAQRISREAELLPDLQGLWSGPAHTWW